MDGLTLSGEGARRTIPVCGPAAFIVLKALAFANRGENKDAYDLIYVLRRWPGGINGVADRLAEHASEHTGVVGDALGKLVNDFGEVQQVGPQRVAAFEGVDGEPRDAAAADAHGYVDDLLRACRARALSIDGP